jgi:hypothetical protein
MGMERERLTVVDTVRASISADGLVLLDVRGGVLFASNHVGARIWQLIEQEHSRVEIATEIAADYNLPIEQAQSDVLAFVGSLVARGLVSDQAQEKSW